MFAKIGTVVRLQCAGGADWLQPCHLAPGKPMDIRLMPVDIPVKDDKQFVHRPHKYR